MNSKLVISGLIGITIAMGCSIHKNMNEMKETTKSLNDTSTEMGKNLGVMKQSTLNLETTSGLLASMTERVDRSALHTYEDMRQSQSLMIRNESLEKVKDPNLHIKTKLSEAAHYLMAYEFQLWKDSDLDSQKKRSVLQMLGVKEFLNQLPSLKASEKDLNDLSEKCEKKFLAHIPAEKKEEVKGLVVGKLKKVAEVLKVDSLCFKDTSSYYAVAGALHSINPNQYRVYENNPNEKPVGMLDLLADGIKTYKDVESGKQNLSQLPSHVTLVQQNLDSIQDLLRHRYNLLVLAVAEDIAVSVHTGMPLDNASLISSIEVLTLASETKKLLQVLDSNAIEFEDDEKRTLHKSLRAKLEQLTSIEDDLKQDSTEKAKLSLGLKSALEALLK